MKQCIRCQEIKDETEFHSDKSRKDKLHPYCKECSKRPRRSKASTLKTLENVIKKLDYITFQEIYGVNTCVCKECKEIKKRHKDSHGKYINSCSSCYRQEAVMRTQKYQRSFTKSLYICVYQKSINCFEARLNHSGKSIGVGYFKTEVEAAKAYNEYVITHNLNRPLNIIEEAKC